MSRYVDGFVIPIPKNKVDEYKKVAEFAGKIWKEYGALDYWECLGEDLEAKDMVSFPQLANIGADETVVFSWIEWPDKATRDAGMKRMMEGNDPRMDPDKNPMPFDGKRLIYGGFAPVLELTR